MILESLRNFVPLYFSLRCTFLLSLFPGAIVEQENSVFSNFLKLLYKLQTFSVFIWIKERKHNILKIY